MFTQFVLTFCSAEQKKKYSSCIYIISDRSFFCASDSSFFKQANTVFGFDGNNREEIRVSGLRKSFSVDLHHASAVGSRQAATVIS